MTRRSKARPIKLLERELERDIDLILDQNSGNPAIAIAWLYTLTLNQGHNCISNLLFQRLMLDYLLSTECLALMTEDTFDPSKGF